MLNYIQSEKIKIKLIIKHLKQKDLCKMFNVKKEVMSMILNCRYQNIEIERKLIEWLKE